MATKIKTKGDDIVLVIPVKPFAKGASNAIVSRIQSIEKENSLRIAHNNKKDLIDYKNQQKQSMLGYKVENIKELNRVKNENKLATAINNIEVAKQHREVRKQKTFEKLDNKKVRSQYRKEQRTKLKKT